MLTRIQSTRYDNDLLTALAADQETALEPVFKRINKEEKGDYIHQPQTNSRQFLARIQVLDALQKKENSILYLLWPWTIEILGLALKSYTI